MSEQLAAGGARVIDPVLTTIARGYRNGMAIYPALFPIVSVGQRGGRIISFRAEDFMAYEIRRAPGADMASIDVGYASDPYALVQQALMGKVPVEIAEEAAAVPGIALGTLASKRAMDTVHFQIELQAATLATTEASYVAANRIALSGNEQWDHAMSKPQAKVVEAKELIRKGIGREPNVLAVGQEVHDALVSNADVIDRLKYTMATTAKTIDEPLLAQYFGVERYVVGRCRKGKPGAFEPVWGKVAILAFTETADLASMGAPTWGYTYRLSGYPVVEQPFYNETKRSWMYPTITEDSPVVAGTSAAVLFTAVVG